MSYDAANYDHYAVESARADPEQIVLGAIRQPDSAEIIHIAPLVGAAPGELIRHAASRSIAWRTRMTRSRFEAVRGALAESGAALIAGRAITPAHPMRIALFVTQQTESPIAVLDWCLANPSIARVVAMASTRAELELVAHHYRVPFFVGGESRLYAPEFFDSIGIDPDLIVLARYMRILPPELVARYPHRIINVHHALLPSFIGARTYERALERGVRVMGATAHYVTDALDEGPIICQQAFNVDPAMPLNALQAHGAKFEALALRNAVAAHAEHRLLPVGQHVIRFVDAS
jgi:formyltetrahydrofolate deformylase